MNEHPQKQRHINLVGPTLLIGFGIILLLNNTGVLDWHFTDIIRLWPLLIIAAGLEALFGRQSVIASFISAIIILVLFVGGVWLLGAYPGGTGEILEISEARNDINHATVILEPAVARLEVANLSDSGNFVEGTVRLGRREKVKESFSTNGRPNFTLRTSNSQQPWSISSGDSRVWDLRFHSDVALNMQTDIGAGEVNFNLRDLTIDEVDVDFGIGEMTMYLPNEGKFEVTISGGIGNITIHVPPNLGVQVNADTGLVTRNIPSTYSQRNNVYTSPDYEAAAHRVTINVELGVGNVDIREQGGE